jgi:hypothetical protein
MASMTSADDSDLNRENSDKKVSEISRKLFFVCSTAFSAASRLYEIPVEFKHVNKKKMI